MTSSTRFTKDKTGKFTGSRPLPSSPAFPVDFHGSTPTEPKVEAYEETVDVSPYDRMLLQSRELSKKAEEESLFSYLRSVQLEAADGEQLAEAYHLLSTEAIPVESPLHYACLIGETRNPTIYFSGSDSIPQEGDIIVLPPLLLSSDEDDAETVVSALDESLPDYDDNYPIRIIVQDSKGVPTGADGEWMIAGEYEVVSTDEDPAGSDAYSIVTLRQTETRYLHPEVEEGDRVVHQRYGPRIVSTVAMTQATRGAYKTGQCYALAEALAEQLGEGSIIGVTVSGKKDTLPWGTRLEDAGTSLTGDWFNESGVHAIAIQSEGTYVDVDGEQDILALKESVENIHSGSLVTVTSSQLRELLTTAPLCFPQDYDTARLVAATVLSPQ